MTLDFSRTIALITRTAGPRDEDGNLTRTESAVVLGGIFAPGGSTEHTDDQQRVIDQPSVLLPTGTAVQAVDAVVVDPVLDGDGTPVLAAGKVQGDRYEVDGDVADWRHPNGWNPGVEVRLRKVTG